MSAGDHLGAAPVRRNRRPADTTLSFVKIAFIPSVSGGLGHVTRVAKLLRGLHVTDPSLEYPFVLSELGLRDSARQATERLGYPVRILPNPVRHSDLRRAEPLGEGP